jgi:hypothetical protein
MKRIVIAGCAVCLLAVPGHAKKSRIEQSLSDLDPSTRLEQLCAAETMSRVHKDRNPHRPDRAVIYAMAKPVLDGDTLSGDGGAFRSKGQWYRYSFVCKASPDHMAVTSFTYRIGEPIPEDLWETHGLYR